MLITPQLVRFQSSQTNRPELDSAIRQKMTAGLLVELHRIHGDAQITVLVRLSEALSDAEVDEYKQLGLKNVEAGGRRLTVVFNGTVEQLKDLAAKDKVQGMDANRKLRPPTDPTVWQGIKAKLTNRPTENQ